MELLWFSGSPFAWRVMLAAELKGAQLTSRMLKASEGEHKTPEYLAINPRGKVPVLRDGDLVISESLAILAYLDRKFPEPPLFGRTPEESGRIWSFVLDYESNVGPEILNVVRPVFFGGLEEKRAEVDTAAKNLVQEFATLEKRLQASSWLMGDEITAADISVYPTIKLIVRALNNPVAKSIDLPILPIEKTHPNIGAWFERIQKLPGYDKTYPPHWKNV